MESTLGIILAEPEAITIFNDLAPGMMDNPLIKLAYGQTVNELTAHMPEGGSDIFFEAIKRLNIEDKQSV